MCGRSVFVHSLSSLEGTLNAQYKYETERITTADARPSYWVPGVVANSEDKRWISSFRWGFDPDRGELYNARIETILAKITWREAFATRRVILPVESFFEKNGHFMPSHEPFFKLAGVWTGTGDMRRAAMLTMPAQGPVVRHHHRMPVIVPDDLVRRFLNPKEPNPKELVAMLAHHKPALREAVAAA